jgi:putative membrane protein
MSFFYIKAIHIIFIVTWFAGMFYMPRFFIYNTEAGEKESPEKEILRKQLTLMMKRLWYGITWPSAILTLIFGPLTWWYYGSTPSWLIVKLAFVAGLYLYHISLHMIFRQEMRGEYRYSSTKFRIWNEVATVFLVVIVMIAVVKQNISVLWGLLGLALFVILLMSAIRIYKYLSEKK